MTLVRAESTDALAMLILRHEWVESRVIARFRPHFKSFGLCLLRCGASRPDVGTLQGGSTGRALEGSVNWLADGWMDPGVSAEPYRGD